MAIFYIIFLTFQTIDSRFNRSESNRSKTEGERSAPQKLITPTVATFTYLQEVQKAYGLHQKIANRVVKQWQ